MGFFIKHFNELTTRELYEILKTRQEIFIIEQDCPYMDIDDLDLDAMHVFSMNEEGRVTSCLRVFMRDKETKTAQIGRVVTLTHGEGLGGELLHEGVNVALNHYKAEKIYLEAQTYAIDTENGDGFPFEEIAVEPLDSSSEADETTTAPEKSTAAPAPIGDGEKQENDHKMVRIVGLSACGVLLILIAAVEVLV